MAKFDAQAFVEAEDVSIDKLQQLTKEELHEVGKFLNLDISRGVKKHKLVHILAEKLNLEMPESLQNVDREVELAKIELEKEKLRLEFDRQERQEREREREREKELRKLELEHELKMKELELSAKKDTSKERTPTDFDLAKNVRLVPKFNEQDVETYFLSFEKTAKKLGWPEKYWPLLLQSTFVGKAQKVYATLSEEQCSEYTTVKAAILTAYELVPEAYRQRFRKSGRSHGQTFVEFARQKEIVFDRWYRSLKIEKSFDELKEVVLMEEFKNSVPPNIKIHLEEHRITKLNKAAIAADDYELTHKMSTVKTNFQSKGNFHRNFEKYKSGSGAQSSTLSQDSSKSSSPSGAKEDQKKFSLVCDYCHKKGHTKAKCFKFIADERERSDKPVAFVRNEDSLLRGKSGDADGTRVSPSKVHVVDDIYKDFVYCGGVSCGLDEADSPVVILRDTGASQSLMLEDVLSLSPESSLNAKMLIQGIGGNFMAVPLHRVNLKCDLFTGPVVVGVVPSLPIKGVEFLLGNDVAGGKVSASPIVSGDPVEDPEIRSLEEEFPETFPECAVTRSQMKRMEKEAAESVPIEEDSGVWLAETFFNDLEEDEGVSQDAKFSRSSLIEQQNADPVLKKLAQTACSEEEAKGVPECYYVKSGVLMRKWRPTQKPADEEWSIVHQIVVPPCYRDEILRIAHEIPVAGHLGIRKTQARVMAHFYWPKLHQDVVKFIKTCHTCQMVGKPQPSIKPAPMIPIPAFDEPFSRVLVDCVGPLPRTKSGHQFLLTIMDLSTRFPEAIPLRKITAKVVVEALVQFFTRYGLPKEVQSDQGSNFMSGVFQEVMRELGIKQVKSSAYHPQSQGALERYHQTLKNMIRAYCEDFPEDWDKGIPLLLFATRDSPNESTGFTPFELVYGHEVRGPLKLIKERFLAEEDETNLLDYVSNFKERLSKACSVAQEHLKVSQLAMKTRADKKSEVRVFKPGEKVLVLLPLPGEPLKAKFSGPYCVKKKLNDVNYVISTPDRRKSQRVCHVNMLKKYYERDNSGQPVGVAVIEPNNDNSIDEDHETDTSELEFLAVQLSNSEILANLDKILDHLNDDQCKDLSDLLHKNKQVCSDKLGHTSMTVHDVDVGNTRPIKQAPYRLNPEKLSKVREEIKYMLEHDIIEPSQSSWSSPIVMVPKPDGTLRFCIDYRKVNTVTKTDSYPIPRLEDCIDRVGNSAFVTKIDLLKGYWQVPLTDRAKEISAFVTPDGLYQCKKMPFGMKNAPATFQRMMSQVIAGLENCVVYIDDILVYSDNWEDHLKHLSALFEKLSEANLVINLKKSEFAKATVTYLGHVVGQGHVLPRVAKIEAIQEFPVPTGKRELMRFLGMSGFYRKFVPNFSTIATPLTKLLQKNVKFVWSDSCQNAFEKLKAILSNEPVLSAPNFDKAFKIAIDASDVGVGAVLLQDDESGIERPISYFSKKLNKYQAKYSTIEKEALGLILALQHFEVYITNSAGETIIYTDHNPLVFLEKFKTKNQRLFRWSLILQPYPLKIVHIAGKNNVIADALSRV